MLPADSPVPSPGSHRPRISWRLALRITAVLLAIAGWWTSIDLLRMTLGDKPTNPWLAAQCGDDENAGCLSVLRSERAYMSADERGRGVPWAALGAGYFALIGLWHLFIGHATRSRWGWHMLVLAVLGCGAWVSLALINVMANELHQWCAGCLTAHALNGALLIVTLATFPWRKDRPGVQPSPSIPLAGAVLTAGMLALFCHGLVATVINLNTRARTAERVYLQIAGDLDFVAWSFARQTPVPLPTGAEVEFIGRPDAVHTVHIFSDLQCPRCREAHANLRRWLDAHPERIRVAYFHYPLDPSCNPHSKRLMHPAACAAATAVEAVRMLGGSGAAETMRDVLYARQRELERGRYAEYASELGIDPAKFAEARRSPAPAERIRADITLAKSLGVDRVPTIFIDGRRFDYWTSDGAWDKILSADAPTSQPALPPP